MKRRQFLSHSAVWGFSPASLALAAPPTPVPLNPIIDKMNLYIPANAGGGWDATGRALGAALQASRQAADVAYDNKGGQGGLVGLPDFVQRYGSNPHALIVSGLVMVGSIALHRPAVDLRQVQAVARLSTDLLVLIVDKDSPYKDAASLMRDLKARPQAVVMAGGGSGGVDHMCTAMIARAAKANLDQLQYMPFSGGGDMLKALADGRARAAVSGYGELKKAILSGQVRALGVTSAKSSFGIPSLREQGVNVDLTNWRGVFAGKGITTPQLNLLREAVFKATQHNLWREALTTHSWQNAWLTGQDFQDVIDLDIAMSFALVKLLHLRKD
jgi:putative tricarboxylic transport membrane protein